MPVTICAATRPESPVELVKAYPTMVNSAEPRHTSIMVRNPARLLPALALATHNPTAARRHQNERDLRPRHRQQCVPVADEDSDEEGGWGIG